MKTHEYQLELRDLRRPWAEEALPTLAAMLPQLGQFTADDLHGKLPEPQHSNWYGVLMACARNAGIIRRVGDRVSSRKEANGRRVAVWEATV